MPKSATRQVIPGSERVPLPGARALGAAHPEERLEVTVQVRARSAPAQDAAALGDQHPGARRYLTHEEYIATHVDFPSSSPHVLGCGGTRLTATASKISSEVVWNEGTNSATGGGVSGFFALPAYQKNAKVPARPGAGGGTGRGVPDVAGDADRATGYQVRVDGQNLVFGGTSAVAPLWAGLVALMNQKLGHRVGFLNPLLYGSLAGKGVVNDISTGNNGAYTAHAGWDACTGWGSPKGTALLKALSS